jgi:transcriptional regulator with XRE-family HTH domain
MPTQLEGDFAQRLRTAMANQGIGSPKLALVTGISYQSLVRYRTGKVEPRDHWGRPTANAWKLSRALDVPLDELVPPITRNGYGQNAA